LTQPPKPISNPLEIFRLLWIWLSETTIKFSSEKPVKLQNFSFPFWVPIAIAKISKFDTIICLDVLEHLADPASQIEIFKGIMNLNSIALFNWYFYKGEKNEYPFHIDDVEVVEKFFKTLQSMFLEVFHPILITTRAYKKIR